MDEPLHYLDWGLAPQLEVTSESVASFDIPGYAEVADILEDTYKRYYEGDCGIFERLASLTIEGRWELPKGVCKTLYSDGTLVTVTTQTAAGDSTMSCEFSLGNTSTVLV